jgi:hypothetical protein
MRAPHSLIALFMAKLLAGSACAPEPKQADKSRPPAAAPAVAPAPPISADSLPPIKKVEADGIVLAELVDGRVRMQATATWGEALDTTYDNCDYFRNALPVLERQLAPERGKHLSEVCVVPPPPAPEKPVKGGKGVKAHQSGTAKAKIAPTTAAKAEPATATPPKPAQPAAPSVAPTAPSP